MVAAKITADRRKPAQQRFAASVAKLALRHPTKRAPARPGLQATKHRFPTSPRTTAAKGYRAQSVPDSASAAAVQGREPWTGRSSPRQQRPGIQSARH
mgnify:CR=1 FL=1